MEVDHTVCTYVFYKYNSYFIFKSYEETTPLALSVTLANPLRFC